MDPGFPACAIVRVEGADPEVTEMAAALAVKLARQRMPRVTGAAAGRLRPIWGDGWFGVHWSHPYVWYQESGTRPFTMRSLAGKVIPMWINDPHGKERAKNPKAKTRRTKDGRTQVLIFRRAARLPSSTERQQMMRRQRPWTPHPGAPGRIAVNRSRGLVRMGDIDPSVNPGWIAPKNIGVKWRHPGLYPRKDIATAIEKAAAAYHLPTTNVIYLDSMMHDTAAVA